MEGTREKKCGHKIDIWNIDSHRPTGLKSDVSLQSWDLCGRVIFHGSQLIHAQTHRPHHHHHHYWNDTMQQWWRNTARLWLVIKSSISDTLDPSLTALLSLLFTKKSKLWLTVERQSKVCKLKIMAVTVKGKWKTSIGHFWCKPNLGFK